MSTIGLVVLLLQLGMPSPLAPGSVPSSATPPMTNLKLWFAADCITLSGAVCSTPSNGSTISAWSDQSGNANDASVASGTCTFNTSQINSKPAVTFSSCHMNFTAHGYKCGNGLCRVQKRFHR